jgi:hypothetical protein
MKILILTNLHAKRTTMLWLFIAAISIRQTSEIRSRLIIRCVNGDSTNNDLQNIHINQKIE